eukprot:306509-Chlamydomonas_euryale.AAC.1
MGAQLWRPCLAFAIVLGAQGVCECEARVLDGVSHHVRVETTLQPAGVWQLVLACGKWTLSASLRLRLRTQNSAYN